MDQASLVLSGAFYVIECALAFLVFSRKRTIFLLLWPILIYGSGPILSLMLRDSNLTEYTENSNQTYESFFFLYMTVILVILDYFFNISRMIKFYIYHPIVRRIGSHGGVRAVFYFVAFLAMILQFFIMFVYGGSIFSGTYALEAILESGNEGFWGFVSGVYELLFVIALCIFAAGNKKDNKFIWYTYLFLSFVRLLGGTRLIIIKELVFILFLNYMQGNISRKTIVYAGAGAVVIGSLVGVLRSAGGGGGLSEQYGVFYSIGAESLLNNITNDIANIYLNDHIIQATDNLLKFPIFLLVSSVPTFVANIFESKRELIDYLSFYTVPSGGDLSILAPIGGMGYLATLIYLSGAPFISHFFAVGAFIFFLKVRVPAALKVAFAFSMCANSISIWRDPLDISVKVIVQGIIFMLVLYLWTSVKKRSEAALLFKEHEPIS